MLELKKITKIYQTGEFKQRALDNVTINFRHNRRGGQFARLILKERFYELRNVDNRPIRID